MFQTLLAFVLGVIVFCLPRLIIEVRHTAQTPFGTLTECFWSDNFAMLLLHVINWGGAELQLADTGLLGSDFVKSITT